MAKHIDPSATNSEVANAASETDVVRERGVVTKIQIAGLELAKTADVEPTGGGVWTVEDCIVNFRRKEGTCKAFRKSRPRTRCTHWWAVAYTIDPPTPEELAMPTSASDVTPAEAAPSPLITATSLPTAEELSRMARDRVRGGYTRFAKDYDKHLRTEFRDFMAFLLLLLPDIGPMLEFREQKKRGPKITPAADLLFASLMHAHLDWSLRRTEGLLAFLKDPPVSIIPSFPGFALTGEFIRSADTTPVLRDVLALTADPFRDFGPMTLAGDGTGASTNRFDDWMVEGKHGIETRASRGWHKAHVACDVDTLSVVACYVTDKDVSEKKIILKHIIPELHHRDYDVEKFLLDGGYNDTGIRDEIIEVLKAEPYIPWASNSKRAVSWRWRNKVKHAALIERIYAAFKTDEGAAFKAEYRYRVKVENLFSSIKTRFGGTVRCLDGNGPENEILLKCICHNIHVLLMAAQIYGLDLSALCGGRAA